MASGTDQDMRAAIDNAQRQAKATDPFTERVIRFATYTAGIAVVELVIIVALVVGVI